ncbi:hypothetical protein DKL61_10285 [Gammaproteobacteria bacterium ESL0073]|nr:hypothetical protein DKL61_10285 [Gammaproteobacteria bacterium ESL0073]
MTHPLPTHNMSTYVYVSCADDSSIDCYQLDIKTDQLRYLRSVNTNGQVMPMAISPDNKQLYAAIRSQAYHLINYQIDHSNAELKKIAQTRLPASMAYITTDRQGKYLLSASYHDNQLFVMPINNGQVSESCTIYNTGLNAHCVVVHPSNSFVYSTSLGSDKLHQYQLNNQNGQLTAIDKGYIDTPKGSGPRHIAISPDGHFLYVVTEMTATVLCYKINPHGALTFLAEIADFPRQYNHLNKSKRRDQVTPADEPTSIWASDIKLTSNGNFLYMAERTSNTIGAFQIDKLTGLPHYIGAFPVEKQPRSFAIDTSGHYMVVTGQQDNHIGLYTINHQTGRLSPQTKANVGKNANWVEIISVPDER